MFNIILDTLSFSGEIGRAVARSSSHTNIIKATVTLGFIVVFSRLSLNFNEFRLADKL